MKMLRNLVFGLAFVAIAAIIIGSIGFLFGPTGIVVILGSTVFIGLLFAIGELVSIGLEVYKEGRRYR